MRDVPLFANVSDAALRSVDARAVRRTFAPDARLWRAGEEPRGLYVILEGRVRIVGERDGRAHVIHVEDAGGVLGEVPLFGGGRYPATAIAERRTTCLIVDVDTITAAIGEDPALAIALLGGLAARVRHLIGRLDGMTGLRVRNRVAAYLLAGSGDGDCPFALGCTQAALAEELGTVREVVARTLAELRSSGVVVPAGRGLWRVTDRAALERLARPAGNVSAAPRGGGQRS